RSLHERGRGRESALDVARAHDGFVEARRESRATAATRLLLAPSKSRTFRKAESPTDFRKRRRRHERGAKRRELAFRRVGETSIELFADDEIDDGIAEELEPLEIGGVLLRMLMEIRAVRQRVLEQRRIREAITADLDVGHFLHKRRKGRGSDAPASPTRDVRRDCAR